MSPSVIHFKFTCTACKETQPVAVECRWCGKNLSEYLRNISGEVRHRLCAMIDGEAEMLRRRERAEGMAAIAGWVGGSPSRRKRARTVFNLPKGWKWRTGKPSRRPGLQDHVQAERDATGVFALSELERAELDKQSIPKRRK